MNAHKLSPRTITAAVALSFFAFAGCDSQDASPESPRDAKQIGRVELNLVGQAPSGNVYRLRDAIITVQGTSNTVVLDTEADPDATTLSATVPAGSYQDFVQEGWHIERLNPDGSATRFQAALMSPNPDQFTVTTNQSTRVPLRFHVGDEEVVLQDGSFEIALEIEDVLSPCSSFQVGPTRECGWSVANGFQSTSCTPGEQVIVGCGCSGGTCAGDPVLRVCEGSGLCSSSGALASVDDACGLCPQASFTCPPSGVYSVLVGSFASGATFTCEPVAQP